MPAGSDGSTAHDLGISQELLMTSTFLQEVMLCQLGICYWHVTEILQTVSNKLPGIRWLGVTGSRLPTFWMKCCDLQGFTIPRILRLSDQWRWRHHVHSEQWEPFNQWHSTTPPHFSPTLLRAPEIMASYLRRLVNLQMYNTSDIWWDSSVNFTNDLGCHNKLLTPAFYWEDCQEWPLNKYDKWNKWSVPQTRRFVSHLVACTREELMMECNVCYQYHQYASNLMVNKAN